MLCYARITYRYVREIEKKTITASFLLEESDHGK